MSVTTPVRYPGPVYNSALAMIGALWARDNNGFEWWPLEPGAVRYVRERLLNRRGAAMARWISLTALALVVVSTTATAAAAQGPARVVHAGGARGAAVDSSEAERRKAANLRGFRGIAARLNTTPEALQYAFENARVGNPKLSRGNFVVANVLAGNLGPTHPNVTTEAILSGLQSGKSVGQTLQSLGLSASDAKKATQAADRQARDAQQRVNDEDKRARADSKAAKRAAHEKKPNNP